jgi:signal transduction histidine kinase
MATQEATAVRATPADDAEAGPDGAARRAAELEALRRMAVEAADTVEPDDLFRIVCACVATVLRADFAAVQLHLLGDVRLWCAERAPAREVSARLFERMEQARRTGRMLAIGTVEGEAGLDDDQRLPSAFGAATAVVLPLAVDGGDGALLVGWHAAGPIAARSVELARTVGEQAAAAFRNAARYDALRQAAVRRDRFFSAMSHDLRTPITAIVGYSELLQDGIMGELAERQQEMVERISQVSGHLSQLVNDILDLAKLDAGRMEFHLESVALGDLVDEAVVAVAPQARSKGLELRLDIDAHRRTQLWVDPPRVRQVLVNLLSNAVKFTDRGSVRVTAGAEEGRGWIDVRDTGPGLPPGAEEAVFEEFLQLASGNKTKREPGSGLGLAISRRLARAMGGDLTARSADESGAVFTLILPPPPSSEDGD